VNKELEIRPAFAKSAKRPMPVLAKSPNGKSSARSRIVISTSILCVALLGTWTAKAQSSSYALGATALLLGSMAGTNSVVLSANPNDAIWNASGDATWLHLSANNQNGVGSTNVVFGYDANPGATRTATLTVAGLPIAITQAGSNFTPVENWFQLPTPGLRNPTALAVGNDGGVYITDSNFGLSKWDATTGQLKTLLSSGVGRTSGLAVDSSQNVYISDSQNNAIWKWTAATGVLAHLVSSGLTGPAGLAIDASGDIFIADEGAGDVKEWIASSNTLITLAPHALFDPCCDLRAVAVDVGGNVYIADYCADAIWKWTASASVLNKLITGINAPFGVAVDGSGNVYFNNYAPGCAVMKLSASDGSLAIVNTGTYIPYIMAVDTYGNLYIAELDAVDLIWELQNVMIDLTPKVENGTNGTDSLTILPNSANLNNIFAPQTDEAWLTITGITNGVIKFSFPATTNAGRTAHISLFDETIAVTQVVLGPPFVLTQLPLQGNGSFQFAFGSSENLSFSVLSSTNLYLPLNAWPVAATVSNIAPELYEFTTIIGSNEQDRFYRLRSP